MPMNSVVATLPDRKVHFATYKRLDMDELLAGGFDQRH